MLKLAAELFMRLAALQREMLWSLHPQVFLRHVIIRASAFLWDLMSQLSRDLRQVVTIFHKATACARSQLLTASPISQRTAMELRNCKRHSVPWFGQNLRQTLACAKWRRSQRTGPIDCLSAR